MSNATLTLEFEGPGTLWLDRVYLFDSNAVLGLWRPDVVHALRAMNPGIVRLGGSTIEWVIVTTYTEHLASFPPEPLIVTLPSLLRSRGADEIT